MMNEFTLKFPYSINVCIPRMYGNILQQLKLKQRSKMLGRRTSSTVLLLNIPNTSAALSRTLSHQEASDRTGRTRTCVPPHAAQGQLTPRANTNRLPGVVPTVETWSPWQTTVYADREVVLPPRGLKLIDVQLISRRGCRLLSVISVNFRLRRVKFDRRIS